MKVYLGIDGGGTKTALCAINAQHECVFNWSGPGSSIDTYSMTTVRDVLYSALDTLPSHLEIIAAFAGLGGVISDTHRHEIITLLQQHPRLNSAVIDADNDVRNALAGSLGTTEGIVLIVGTGSVAYGYFNQHSWRSGGYSHLEGDPGSAYDIGLSALRLTARALDGRRQHSPLTRAILTRIQVTHFAELAAVFNHYTRGEIAALAQVVTELSSTRDAQYILKQGARECARMVSAVVTHLGYDQLEVGLIGGAVQKSLIYQDMICKEILHLHPHLHLVKHPRLSPDHGAALIAYHGVSHV